MTTSSNPSRTTPTTIDLQQDRRNQSHAPIIPALCPRHIVRQVPVHHQHSIHPKAHFPSVTSNAFSAYHITTAPQHIKREFRPPTLSLLCKMILYGRLGLRKPVTAFSGTKLASLSKLGCLEPMRHIDIGQSGFVDEIQTMKNFLSQNSSFLSSNKYCEYLSLFCFRHRFPRI